MRNSARVVILHFGIVLSLTLASVPWSTGSITRAQQPVNSPPDDHNRGIELHEHGEVELAIQALRTAVKSNKNDISAWHYLALANEQSGDRAAARKAHEKAAILGQELLTRELARKRVRDFGAQLDPFEPQLLQAAASSRKYLDLNPKLTVSLAEEWRQRAEYLSDFSSALSARPPGGRIRILSSEEVSTKLRVTSQAEPEYPPEARTNHTTGRVVLRVLFTADGKVQGLFPIQGLGDGLSAASIRAARQIKFIPATKDGKAVSEVSEVEYNFSIYP